MIHIAICDDDEIILKRLKEFISDFSSVVVRRTGHGLISADSRCHKLLSNCPGQEPFGIYRIEQNVI